MKKIPAHQRKTKSALPKPTGGSSSRAPTKTVKKSGVQSRGNATRKSLAPVKYAIDLVSTEIGEIELFVAVSGAATSRALLWARPGGTLASAKRSIKEVFPGSKLVSTKRVSLKEFARVAQSITSCVQSGTAFEQKVWRALCAIPCGTTQTYQQLAKSIGMPAAHRAVANACGRNEIGVLIPCHRVVRTDGSLGGYRWGVEIKRKLLAFELSE